MFSIINLINNNNNDLEITYEDTNNSISSIVNGTNNFAIELYRKENNIYNKLENRINNEFTFEHDIANKKIRFSNYLKDNTNIIYDDLLKIIPNINTGFKVEQHKNTIKLYEHCFINFYYILEDNKKTTFSNFKMKDDGELIIEIVFSKQPNSNP